ncbi:MAG: sialidase family protein [Chloroflexota bacterium]
MPQPWLRPILLAPLGVLLALCVLLPAAGPAQAGEETGWSTPLRISGPDPRAGGWFPAITTDVYGHVHVVWNGRAPRRPAATTLESSQRTSDAAGWLIYAHSDGQKWSPPSEIAAIGEEGDALRSSLTADTSGNLHLLYRGIDLKDPKVGGAENEPMRYASVNALQAEWPASWSAGAQFSRRTPAYFPEITTDSRGTLHALTTEADAKGKYTVYYRRSEDQGKTWSLSTPIETTLAVSRWRAQLKVGPNDDLNAVWEVVDPDEPSGRNPVGFVYARSTDGGQSWSTRVFAPPRKDYLYAKQFEGTRWRLQPAVGVDGRGQIVLVWREYETDTIYFQRSTDGVEWTAPARMGGITKGLDRPFDRYDMALDSVGRLHLVLVAYPDGSPIMSLLHAEWLGYTWSTPKVITRAASAPFPEWPRIAIGEGNRLHVAWFGGSIPTVDRVPIGIWYSTKRLDQAALPVAPVPTRGPGSGVNATPATGSSQQSASAPPVPGQEAVTAPRPTGTPIARPSQPARNLDVTPLPVVQGLAVAATVLVLFLLFRVRHQGGRGR